MKYVLLSCLLLIGCGPTHIQKPKAVDNCFDYESCQRACKMFNDQNACENKKHFHKK